ncbi:MAG: (d)CMP kinase [Burkholderiales bacterium]|jgi:cytidylate kinase
MRDESAGARPPVIAIDGPAASGKGTLAQGVATALGYRCLDSGSLYRMVALQAVRQNVALDDEPRLAALADGLETSLGEGRIFVSGQDVTEAIRAEPVSAAASRVAVLPRVRTALLTRQRAFRAPPGLVAEGRDMGTIVFPDARLKIYLTASAAARARRRYKQLIDKGNPITIEGLLRDIEERDARDSARPEAPLKAAADAIVLDTTDMAVDAAIAYVLQQYQALTAGGPTGRH